MPTEIEIGPLRVRSLAEVSPAYSELLRKQAELNGQLYRLNAESDDIVRRTIEERNADAGNSRAQRQAAARERIDPAVAVALGEAPETPKTNTSDQQRLEEIGRQRNVLTRALTIVGERLGRERLIASRIIAAEVDAPHKELVAKLCEALIAVNAAWTEYRDLTDSLTRENFAWVDWRGMMPHFLGATPRGADNKVGRYLRLAVENGFISETVLPATLRMPSASGGSVGHVVAARAGVPVNAPSRDVTTRAWREEKSARYHDLAAQEDSL